MAKGIYMAFCHHASPPFSRLLPLSHPGKMQTNRRSCCAKELDRTCCTQMHFVSGSGHPSFNALSVSLVGCLIRALTMNHCKGRLPAIGLETAEAQSDGIKAILCTADQKLSVEMDYPITANGILYHTLPLSEL